MATNSELGQQWRKTQPDTAQFRQNFIGRQLSFGTLSSRATGEPNVKETLNEKTCRGQTDGDTHVESAPASKPRGGPGRLRYPPPERPPRPNFPRAITAAKPGENPRGATNLTRANAAAKPTVQSPLVTTLHQRPNHSRRPPRSRRW